MTRKHYEKLAQALNNTKPLPEWGAEMDQWRTTVVAICEDMGTFNPNFDKERFLKACGYDKVVK